jgi:phosphohistidine phosphatase
MQVVLLRHGPAEERDPRRWPSDDDRPLTKDGGDETRRAIRGLARLKLGIDLVVSSSAARAKGTAEIAHDELGVRRAILYWKELSPGTAAAPVMHRLSEEVPASRFPILVGHEPTLGELLSYSLHGDAVSITRLSRCGAVGLEFPRQAVPGGAILVWLFTRKQLSMLAE